MDVCTGCGEECRLVSVDFGIGAYEYWGAVGYDSRVERVSHCCEHPVSENFLPTDELFEE